MAKNRINSFAMLLCGALGVVPLAAHGPAELDDLLAKLVVEKSSNEATETLRKKASENPTARVYLSRQLPVLLESYKQKTDGNWDLVWGNEAKLAGEFKVPEAVPALCRRIDMNTGGRSGGSLGYNFVGFDAVNALIQIGPPAVPATIGVLKRGTALQREMAAHILRNIGTDAAWRALEEALPKEKDANVRQRIKDSLETRQ